MRAASRLSTSDQLRVPVFFTMFADNAFADSAFPVRASVKGVCMEVYTFKVGHRRDR
jgi:hypothetical protein